MHQDRLKMKCPYRMIKDFAREHNGLAIDWTWLNDVLFPLYQKAGTHKLGSILDVKLSEIELIENGLCREEVGAIKATLFELGNNEPYSNGLSHFCWTESISPTWLLNQVIKRYNLGKGIDRRRYLHCAELLFEFAGDMPIRQFANTNPLQLIPSDYELEPEVVAFIERVHNLLSAGIKGTTPAIFKPVTVRCPCCSVVCEIEAVNDRQVYQCPICKASVGMSADFMPTGRPASAQARKWRMELHQKLNRVIETKLITKSEAYRVMAQHLGESDLHTHIGNVITEEDHSNFCRAIEEVYIVAQHNAEIAA